jgi:hypothetical protein
VSERTFRGEGVIILGTPRSGTTLLRRLIDAHPAIACPGETNVFTGCGRFLRSECIAEGVRIGALDGLGYAGFPRDEVLRRLREFAFTFHREYAARKGKLRWASKTAFDAFYLAEMEELCGDQVDFICIQRHGLDVACSIQELCEKNGGYLHELHDYVVRYPLTLDAFAHVWVDLAQAIHHFAARHPDNALVVTYEELTARTDATMTRIMEFVGETWEPALVGRALADRTNLGLGDWKTYAREIVDQESVGRWKRLSRDTISRLGAICNPTLELCGYESVPVDTEHGADDSRRRYEIGLLLQGLSKKRPTTDAGTAAPAEPARPGRKRRKS